MRKPSASFWILISIFLLGATYEGGILVLNGGANSYGDLTVKSGGVVVDTGSITATAGDVVDQYASVRRAYPQQVAGAPAEPFDCLVGVRGWIIYVDDTDDTAEAYLCFCGVDADDLSYEWFKANDPTVNCF